MTLAGERVHTGPPDPASRYLRGHKMGTEESPGPTSNVKAVEVILREPWARGHGREVAQQSLAHHVSRSITLAPSPPRSVASANPELSRRAVTQPHSSQPARELPTREGGNE